MKKSIMFFLSLDEADFNIVLYKITNYAIFVFSNIFIIREV